MQNDDKSSKVLILFRGRGVVPSWPDRLSEAQRQATVIIDGRVVPRIRYGSEGRGWGPASQPCHDCTAIRGEFHVLGCDVERCPSCRGQAFICGCADDSRP